MAESDLHRAALATLHQYGWQRRRLGNTTAGFCLIGAYQHNQLRTVDRWPAIKRLQGLCGDKDLARWQDKPWRRKRQVLALVERAYGEALLDEARRGLARWVPLGVTMQPVEPERAEQLVA